MSHRHTPPGTHEHEFEPQHGLPEPLPPGERLLWQGSPDWRSLAVRAFHVRKLALYFGALLALRAGLVVSDGGSALEAARPLAWLAPLALTAIGIVLALAWLSARTAVYTITDRRVVMRIGIVLTVTYNLPLKVIQSAGLRTHRDGTGDIALALPRGERIAWLQLWPHARPWHFSQPQPMLRALADPQPVARVLGGAWSAVTGRATAPLAPVVQAPVGTRTGADAALAH